MDIDICMIQAKDWLAGGQGRSTLLFLLPVLQACIELCHGGKVNAQVPGVL